VAPIPLSLALLDEAAAPRAGIVPPCDEAEGTFADLPGFVNAFVTDDGGTGESTGGLGRTRAAARAAAIGEALERYAASHARLPLVAGRALPAARRLDLHELTLHSEAQRARADYPFVRAGSDETLFAPVFDLVTNEERWAPAPLVGLGAPGPAVAPSTSTGIACGPSPEAALESATLELLERDALASAWLTSMPGRPLALLDEVVEAVRARGGTVEAWDLTQRWNPCPVVAVTGGLPLRGLTRLSLGAACRLRRDDAVDKALREWIQGVIFVGHQLNESPRAALDVPRTFVEHGLYYTLNPSQWDALPLRKPARAPAAAPAAPAPEISDFPSLLRALADAGIRTYYRDLTTRDVAALGLTVARVLAPALTPLAADHRWPCLGGRALDHRWRWPDRAPVGAIPNPLPHALG
jgi:ribosomal protein S12 methylthiotransferase accessory factor